MIDKRSEYFVDFYNGISQFYKIQETGDREKIKKPKYEDSLVSVTKKDNKYLVTVDNLALPTKTLNYDSVYEIGMDFESAFNVKGQKVSKKALKDLKETKGQSIDLKSALDKYVTEIPEISYFTGFYNELVSIGEF